MKSKTIKAILRKKIDSWLSTIEDENLRKEMKKDIIVTGGAIASMLLREKVNDYDIYFRTFETTKQVAEYYVKRFDRKNKKGIPVPIIVQSDEETKRVQVFIKSAGVASEEGTEKPYEYFEASPDSRTESYISEVMDDPGDIQDAYDETEQCALEECDDTYRPVFMSSNAITLSNRIQIVLRFIGEPDTIHENYDFVHCTNYWTSKDSKLTLRKEALEALITRELRYFGSKYPVCSIIRLRKFINRGWTINAGQILKMVMQVNELDLTNPDVLQDQLTGVDAAYFSELIYRLKEKDPDKVNSAYLIEIIERLF